ncbi:MAG: DUF4037 domain-containing protein [Clostridia bacterium]|nr:DUF4037 domain-containing protein [Clostridia bacterium]
MKGLEIARAYWETCGQPMMEERFPELLPVAAAGLCGSGSECFGYDDELSRDHDFEPGFILFLPGENVVDRRTAFQLERAYAALPKEFMGMKRASVQPVGGARHGVIRMSDFFSDKTGYPDGSIPLQAWLKLPDWALAEAVNGEIFRDDGGQVTGIRERLSYYPEDVRRKKLAGNLLLMAQSGQYNYARCLRHGESGAAQLATGEFVRAAMQTVFLLNRVYQPYYKWSFRAMRGLPRLSLHAALMEYLLTTGNDGKLSAEKQDVMEGIAADIIEELQRQELTQAICGDLEKHAYSVQDGIRAGEIRNLHILAAV